MERALANCVVMFLGIVGLAAQDFVAGLKAVQVEIDAKEWKRALELLLALPAVEQVDQLDALGLKLNEVGDGLIAVEDLENALRAHTAEVAIAKRRYGGLDHASVATGLSNAAYCLVLLGRAEEALPQHTEALAMRKRLCTNGEDRGVALALNNVAYCLQSLGRSAEALPMYEEALALWKRWSGNRDDEDVALGLNNVAYCLQSLGRFEEALPLYEESLAVRRRLGGDDHEDVLTAVDNVANCLRSLGRIEDALPRFEDSLAIRRRLHGDADHVDLVAGLNEVARCLRALRRFAEALPRFEESLAIRRRLHGGGDHADVLAGLNDVARCLQSLGRFADALPLFEDAVAICTRLQGGRDHLAVALMLSGAAACLQSLGRSEDALSRYEESLAIRRRARGGGDHTHVVAGLNDVARCLESLGRFEDALPRHEESLAITRQVHGGGDHAHVAASLLEVADCLRALGRFAEALPHYEVGLAMVKRMRRDQSHSDVETFLNRTAVCLESLGRAEQALPIFEAALAMKRQLSRDPDHPEVAMAMNNVAFCLQSLGRLAEAVPLFEKALAATRRHYGASDHRFVAMCLNNVGFCMVDLGRAEAALPLLEEALAMRRRVHESRDHTEVASTLNTLAGCLGSVGRKDDALERNEEALAMWRRLFRDRDHPLLVMSLGNTARCLEDLDRGEEALRLGEEAVGMVERLRGAARTSPELRQSLFEALKKGGAFEMLQRVAHRSGRASQALHAAERSRGRDLMDQLAQFGDLGAEASRRARQRGDEATAARIASLRTELDAAGIENDRLLRELTKPPDRADERTRAERRASLSMQSNAVSAKVRQLLDERARLLAEVLPIGCVRTDTEIQGSLREGELFLEFTVASSIALLFIVDHDGAVHTVELRTAPGMVHRLLPVLLQQCSWRQLRGRDPDDQLSNATPSKIGTELFASLIPPVAWERIKASRRVFIAAHRELHRLPFELLVTEIKDDKPVMWIDEGPPISYVPSGTMLHWIRKRAMERSTQLIPTAALIVGDPRLGETTPPALGSSAEAVRFVHHDDLERLSKLPQLKGARAEAEAIAAAFRGKEARAELLLGEKATEPAVFDLAAKARYLHFACHGIAEEYAGQSLSILALTQPKDVNPGDDGFLKLGDLFNTWGGRLEGCQLVVLSACRTNVGDTGRDESPQALPIGFLFAGAPAVISTLWAVDDASTKELMTDFYGRLLAGEADKLAAFTAAKKALRAKYPDPFHWAPFLYIGAPD